MTTPARKTRDQRRAELQRLPKSRLCTMYRNGIYTPDGKLSRYVGGQYPPEQWRKDEVIGSILDIEYPATPPAPPRVVRPPIHAGGIIGAGYVVEPETTEPPAATAEPGPRRDWRTMTARDFDTEQPTTGPQLALFAPDSQGRITPDLLDQADDDQADDDQADDDQADDAPGARP